MNPDGKVTLDVDALPDLASLADDDLEQLFREAEREEDAISRRRRFLHGRIDLLRAERVARLRQLVETGALVVEPPTALERPLFEGTGDVPDETELEPIPDLATTSDDDLRNLIQELEREEDDISLRRRFLHGRIDILAAERERRRRGGRHLDPDDLGPILGGPRR